MNIIFVSNGTGKECEERFVAFRKAYPDIKRVHGAVDPQRLLSICAAISDDPYFAVVDGDADFNADISSLEKIVHSKDGRGVALPANVSVFNTSEIAPLEQLPQDFNADDLDIVYLTYDEPIADENFAAIKEKYPRAMRLHRVTGMTKAFATAPQLVNSPWYVLIDGDNTLLPAVDLNVLRPPSDDSQGKLHKTVLVHGARNAVNDLEYCYGGIKICPTLWFRGITADVVDPIASRGTEIVFMPDTVLSTTNFNSDAYGAWKAGFRESVMLSTSCLLDFDGAEGWGWLDKYLNAWKTLGHGRPYGDYCMDGANDGHRYAQEQAASIASGVSVDDFKRLLTEKLSVINEPGWLKDRFQSRYALPLMNEKFNSAAEADPHPIRLCAVIGDNCDMLPHFIDHYRDLGVHEFHIILHAPPGKEGFCAEALRIMEEKGIEPAQIYDGGWDSRISTNLINGLKAQYPDDWFIVADSDELQVYEKPLRDVIKASRENGMTYITGSFVDRVSGDGSMKAIDHQSSVWQQFPYAGFVSFPLSGAMPYKITACKGNVVLSQGQHGVLTPESKWPVTGKVEAQVHHFKWNKNVYDNLVSRQLRFKDAYDSLNDGDRAYYLECASVLKYLNDNRGLSLNEKAFLLSKSGNQFGDYAHWNEILKRTDSWDALQASPRVGSTAQKVERGPSP